MTSENLTITKHCETASEFMAALSPRGEYFGNSLLSEWIFRGHACDEFKLLPVALRDGSKALASLVPFSINESKDQQNAEKEVLAQFLELSDRIGLALPEDTQKLRRLLQRRRKSPEPEIEEWPPDEILSLMALAQHSGLPTRLLDWSRNPFKAALFASGPPRKKLEEVSRAEGRLSVWAFHLSKYKLLDSDLFPFTLVTAPGASNLNLRAQEGLFTVAKRIKGDGGPIDRSPFEEIFSTWAETYQVTHSGSWFRRITLPRSEAENLGYELSLEGIGQTSILPDFYGVVKAMQEQRRWSRPGGPAAKRMQLEGMEWPSISVTKSVPYSEVARLFPPPNLETQNTSMEGSTIPASPTGTIFVGSTLGPTLLGVPKVSVKISRSTSEFPFDPKLAV